MEQKKNKNVDLERNRGSILMIGLVCATSLTLMSFEYANFELKQEHNLMSQTPELIDPWTEPVIEVIKPAAPTVAPKPKVVEFVEADENVTETESEEEIVLEDDSEEKNIFDLPALPGDFGPGEIGTPIDSVELPVIPDKMPHFPGGDTEMYKYLSEKITFPSELMGIGIQGKVYVQFTVEKDGSITDIEVAKAPHIKLGEEASEAVEGMPTWVPGYLNNQPVRVRYSLPVNFILN